MQGSFPQAVLSIELEFSDLGWYFFEKIWKVFNQNLGVALLKNWYKF